MEKEYVGAKVFISCGQWDGNERRAAEGIKTKLEGLGYQPYVATKQQSLKGVRDNIFRELETSEYFVFVDFKREELKDPPMSRGSLFSHQELAVASYLGLEVIALQESGVKADDGLMRFLQANSKQFPESAREHVPAIVSDMVRENNWSPHWKNQLDLSAVPSRRVSVNFNFPPFGRMPKPCQFFQIPVSNRHKHKPAVTTCVYLERLYDKSREQRIPLETTEFKWSGFDYPYALIAPGSMRYFDAFFVVHQDPTKPWFLTHTGSSHYVPKVPGEGDYELTYAVISQSFPPVRATFQLHVADSLQEYRLQLIPPAGRAGESASESL